MRQNGVFKSMLYIPKHEKLSDDTAARLFLPSVLGLVLCMVCLAGMTWAWFSANIHTKSQGITAADYRIAVEISGAEETEEGYLLTAGLKYDITLKAAGRAQKGGYCVVSLNGQTIHRTAPLKAGESLAFALIPDQTGAYAFDAVWGSYDGNADIHDGSVIGEKAEQQASTASSDWGPASPEPQSMISEAIESIPALRSDVGGTASEEASSVSENVLHSSGDSSEEDPNRESNWIPE